MSATDAREFEASWPAVPDSVPRARRAVLRFLRDAETADPPLRDIGLAVSEGVTNVVHHAYAGDGSGEVRVGVSVLDEVLQVTVADEGRGMAPRDDSPGLGLGLPLIARVTERFDTRTHPDGGTTLCMWFRRQTGDRSRLH